MIEIRQANPEDFPDIWPVIHEAFQSGETYSFSPDTSPEEGFRLWLQTPLATYVAVVDGRIMGTYFLKQNQPGLGSHVCNAGYVVSSAARGQGLGRALCRHSLEEAGKLGFKAMQYNFVVSTNDIAVRLWQECGFSIVGTVPKAFRHRTKGLVDIYIMYQWLS